MILKEQRLIILGTLLGDGYLQKTGKKNARLKIDHSIKQKEYIFWKYEKLKNLAQDKPKLIKRYNPIFKKEYHYYRFQTYSMNILGKYKRWFYKDNKKVIPDNIENIIKHPLVLAVWYMDDGYMDKKNKALEIYLPKYEIKDLNKLVSALKNVHNIIAEIVYKKNYPVIRLKKEEAKKFVNKIEKHVIECMKYKISFSPVTTGGVNAEGPK